jgi:hypothetical protein
VRVFPTLDCKRVVVGQPGRQHVWKFKKRRAVSRFQSSPLFVFLIQFIDYSEAFLYALSFLYFLRWSVSHTSFIYRYVIFPLSLNSGCSGVRGSDGQYSSYMVHGVGDIFCCYSRLLDFVHLRVVPGIWHLYTRTTPPDFFITSFM